LNFRKKFVDINELVTQILDRAPGAVLEKSRFGRSDMGLFWLHASRLEEVARLLKSQAGFDCLENLSAMQLDENLLFTYFVRKSETDEMIALRVSVEAGPGEEWVELQSVASVWPMAEPLESEASRLLGAKIPGQPNQKEWDGFPLRKSFVFHGGVSP
jgi:NADH:ubiquinone oxidoreductase subunit C